MTTIEKSQQISEQLVSIRNELHKNPEVSYEEFKTAEFIKHQLELIGCEVISNSYACSVVGVIKGDKQGKTVALRADMDALSMQELNEVSYKSQNNGVMHSCGHDVHMTALLGAAQVLQSKKNEICGTVKLIFQPAEEKSPTGGSRGIISSGILQDVDAIFGMHVWPALPHGVVGFKSGALMAASDHFSVKITGKCSHAATPESGIDSIFIASLFVQALQGIVSRQINPIDSAVITIGKMNAGTRYNIIAESCELEGTCRTLNENVREFIEMQMQKTLDGICSIYGAKGEINYERGYMALINDEKMIKSTKETVIRLFGEKFVQDITEPSMCAEDFSFYLKEKTGAFLWMGTAREGNSDYPLHNPNFDVDTDILWRGAALLSQIALDFLS